MIEILMATYNGEKYIAEQIESLLNQTSSNWKLLIRDDGSKDKTISIVRKYIEKYPDKIKLIEDQKKGLGARDNFLELLKMSTSDYVMFCDQDDVWLPNKIELTLKKMMEKEQGPTLIHSDLKVVDSDLKILSESIWEYQQLFPDKKDYNNLITECNIVGCTIMINRSLANLCQGDFPNGVMHDWIVGVIASLKAKIYYVEESTILYRQHGKNTIGVKGYYKNFYEKFKKIKELKKRIYNSNLQLQDILKNIEIEDEALRKKLEEYVELPNKGFFYRKKWIIKNNFMKQGVLKKIGQILLY